VQRPRRFFHPPKWRNLKGVDRCHAGRSGLIDPRTSLKIVLTGAVVGKMPIQDYRTRSAKIVDEY